MTGLAGGVRVVFDGQQTAGAWGAFIRAAAPYSATGVLLQPCGSTAALQRHYRKGEDPCPPCRVLTRKRPG